MSYPAAGGSQNLQIRFDPPLTARELLDQFGHERVLAAMRPEDREDFERDNRRPVVQADRLLRHWQRHLAEFDTELDEARRLDHQRDPRQIQFRDAAVAPLRANLLLAVAAARRAAEEQLRTYRRNLVDHLDRRGETARIADRIRPAYHGPVVANQWR